MTQRGVEGVMKEQGVQLQVFKYEQNARSNRRWLTHNLPEALKWAQGLDLQKGHKLAEENGFQKIWVGNSDDGFTRVGYQAMGTSAEFPRYLVYMKSGSSRFKALVLIADPASLMSLLHS